MTKEFENFMRGFYILELTSKTFRDQILNPISVYLA